jgi:hypothetical protein
MPKLVSVKPANDGKHKYTATFLKEDGKEIQTKFGAEGYMDFIQYNKVDKLKAQVRKQAYLIRHRNNENWNDRTSAGALSRWILWNLPTLEASIADFRRRFP